MAKAWIDMNLDEIETNVREIMVDTSTADLRRLKAMIEEELRKEYRRELLPMADYEIPSRPVVRFPT